MIEWCGIDGSTQVLRISLPLRGRRLASDHLLDKVRPDRNLAGEWTTVSGDQEERHEGPSLGVTASNSGFRAKRPVRGGHACRIEPFT